MNTNFKSLFLVVLITIAFASCKKTAVKIITTGTWTVGLYYENGNDETDNFLGYVFDFKTNGTMAVTKPSGDIVNGSWSYDDGASKYIISISGSGALDKVNNSWLIVSKSSSLIELKDDNITKDDRISFKKK